MKQILTVCPRDCYDTCSLTAYVNDSGDIVSIEPDSENPITQNFLCPRGIKDIERLYKNRIASPSLKKNNDFHAITWSKSLELISDKINDTIDKYGRKSMVSLGNRF